MGAAPGKSACGNWITYSTFELAQHAPLVLVRLRRQGLCGRNQLANVCAALLAMLVCEVLWGVFTHLAREQAP